MTDSDFRPDIDEYMMAVAITARLRANCLGTRVGAVLAQGAHIVSTGYNGTPSGMTNCAEGGCYRCRNKEHFSSGIGYDVCICVHAEQNALLAAAKFGIRVNDSTLYSTARPCFGCAKEALQAGVQRVFYLNDWRHPNTSLRKDYISLSEHFPKGVKEITLSEKYLMLMADQFKNSAQLGD